MPDYSMETINLNLQLMQLRYYLSGCATTTSCLLMLICVTVGPFIINAPALWDRRLQLFDVLKRGKSMTPEGVTPLRAAKHKSDVKNQSWKWQRQQLFSLLWHLFVCTFVWSLVHLILTKFASHAMVYFLPGYPRPFLSKLELILARVLRMTVGNYGPESNMLMFCQHVVGKHKQSL